MIKLKNYINFVRGIKIGNGFITNNSFGNIPYICGINLILKKRTDIPYTTYFITHDTAKYLKLDLVQTGDILVAKNREDLGHLCLISTKEVKAYFNCDEIVCIRTHSTATPKFMYYMLMPYLKKIKNKAKIENIDQLFKPENFLYVNVPYYSLEDQNEILDIYNSLCEKENKANLMIDDIMQDLVYLYRSYFDGDTSEKVTIGSTLERYLRYNEKTPIETKEYKTLNEWKDVEPTDGHTLNDAYNSIKSDTPSLCKEDPIHQDCVYISIDGSDIGECGLYHKDLFKKSIYFALTPTEKYPALYLYFILSFHSSLTKSEDTDNKLIILPSSIEQYPLSTDYDRIAQFSKAVEEPLNDINGIIEDIRNIKEYSNSIVKSIFKTKLNIRRLKRINYKFNMYR